MFRSVDGFEFQPRNVSLRSNHRCVFFISDGGVNLRGCCCYFLSFNGVAMRDWLMRFEVVTVSSHTIFRSISALLFSALLFLIVFVL